MAAIDEQRIRQIVREELSKIIPKVMAEVEQKLPVAMQQAKARTL